MERKVRYIDMDLDRLKRLKRLAADARAAVAGLADDAAVAPADLPAEIVEALGLEAPVGAAECRALLGRVEAKAGLALSVRDLRQGATFNQVATRLLFDRERPQPGSLEDLFRRRG